MPATDAPSCWCCGQPVPEADYYRSENGVLTSYQCLACGVSWRASPWLNPTFSDPKVMATPTRSFPLGFVDHGAVHAPCP